MFGRGPRSRPLRPVRVLNGAAALRLALEDPLVNALPGARLQELRDSAQLGREFSLHGGERAPDGLLWHGVNAGPLSASAAALDRFGEHLAQRPGVASSLVGPREALERMWPTMAPTWEGRVREHRWSQPLLVAEEPNRPGAPTGLRRALPEEEAAVYPAAVAMFREEVGTDPTSGDHGRAYRARVRQMLRLGRTYAVLDADGAVVFKADVGALFGPVAQIHGVWTRPQDRGCGIASRAMAELVDLVRADHAPQVSLYVNDFNEAARRAYAAAGFRPAGELATILL